MDWKNPRWTRLTAGRSVKFRQCSTMPQLSVSPRVALVDEKVAIQADGLNPYQEITIQAWLKERAVFCSLAHMKADSHGRLDLTSQASLGGTYTGVDAMGLFWSMKPAAGESPTSRLVKLDVTKPFLVNFALLEGHIEFDDLPLSNSSSYATSVTAERWYKHSTVKRILVREGSLRGTLFLPQGPGPFPGVIEMSGSAGGLVETRAALLASRGFATFALAYLGYDDLPKLLEELDLDYLLQAVEWLNSHPAVKTGGVAVFGFSKGAELAQFMAIHSKKVKAVVSVSGAMFYTFKDLMKGGELFHKGAEVDPGSATFQDGNILIRECYQDWENHVIPLGNSNAKFLFLYGEDDQNSDPSCNTKIMEKLPLETRQNLEVVFYPETGHIIEPPYTPHCYASLHKLAGMNLVWGGSPKPHAFAQEDGWLRALDFLHKHMGQTQKQNCQTESRL